MITKSEPSIEVEKLDANVVLSDITYNELSMIIEDKISRIHEVNVKQSFKHKIDDSSEP